MKNMVSAVALLAVLVSGSALAADLPSHKSAPVYVPAPPVFSWTGLYLGANVGGSFSDAGNGSGVSGGGQIGYNYRLTPLFVTGVEADFQGTSVRNLAWFGTVRGRLGVTPFDPHFLVYGTGGFAYGEVRRDFGGFGFNNSNTVKTGWTAGGGVEWAFLPNWSAKVEYLYTDLSSDDNNGVFFAPISRHRKFHTVRAGLNYHFNFGAPAPILAKY